MEESRSAFKVLTGKPTWKKPVGRSQRRSETIIRMNLKEIGVDMRNWVDLVQDRDYCRAQCLCECDIEPHKPWSEWMNENKNVNATLEFVFSENWVSLHEYTMQFSGLH